MGIYVYRNNQVEGPFDELVIQQALANGSMIPDEQCRREGKNDWIPASALFHPLPPVLKRLPLQFRGIQNQSISSSGVHRQFQATQGVKPKIFQLGNAKLTLIVGGAVILSVLFVFVGVIELMSTNVSPVIASQPATSNVSSVIATESATSNPVSVKTRLDDVSRQIDQIDQQSVQMLIQAASVAYEADQIQKNEERGFLTSPEEKANVLKQALFFSVEGSRLGNLKKQLVSEKEDLEKQVQQ